MTLLFSDNLLRSLSWTFVHSLWMGLLLTIAGAVIMLTTKRSSPSLRYGLLCFSFFAFLIAIVAVFIITWNDYGLNTDTGPAGKIAGHSALPLVQQVLTWLDTVLTGYRTWIVSVWFILFMARAIKMVNDLQQVRRLRTEFTVAPVAEWQLRFKKLCSQLNIHTPVRLLESALVNVPLVIGHLKPVVLVPAGIFNNLSAAEMEAVLLHELAHIRRHDYFVNLIQRIAEMIFFFNPGFLWISSLLRSERENCCDDVVIVHTHDKERYVNALIRFREHMMQHPSYALGFPGQGKSLFNRIFRIVYSKNRSLSAFEGVFAAMSIVVCTALLTQSANKVPETVKQSFAAVPANRDATASVSYFNAIAMQASETSKSTATKPVRKTTRQAQPDRTAAIDIHETVKQQISTISYSAPEKTTLHTIDKKREEADEQRRLAEKQRKEADELRQLAALSRAEAETQRKEAEIQRFEAQKQREEAEVQRKKADEFRAQAEVQRKEAELQRIQAEKLRRQAELIRSENTKSNKA